MSAAFETAYKSAGSLKSEPSNNDKLALYALAKIAKGEDITKAPSVGSFDFAGKAKRREWQKLVDEGITKEQAEEKYVAKFKELRDSLGLKDDASEEAKNL